MDALYDAIERDTEISVATKKCYKQMLKTVINKKLDIYSQPEECYKRLEEMYKNKTSLKGCLGHVRAFFKYEEGKEKHKESYEAWGKYHDALCETYEKERKENVLTENQKEGFVAWEEVVKTYQALTDPLQKLCLGMYCLIPPRRVRDYAQVKMVWEGEEPKEGNYMMCSDDKIEMVIQDFKSAKHYGAYRENLPAELVKVIYDAVPRDQTYLFVNQGKQSFTEHAFNVWLLRRLNVIFKKPVTINCLRRSFTSSLDLQNMTETEREKVGLGMGHNASQQLEYRVVPKNNENSGKKQEKKVVDNKVNNIDEVHRLNMYNYLVEKMKDATMKQMYEIMGLLL